MIYYVLGKSYASCGITRLSKKDTIRHWNGVPEFLFSFADVASFSQISSTLIKQFNIYMLVKYKVPYSIERYMRGKIKKYISCTYPVKHFFMAFVKNAYQ